MVKREIGLAREAKAWLKRKNGANEFIRVVPGPPVRGAAMVYNLYTSFENFPDHLGDILFDEQGYWIYDGDSLAVEEQEQIARFIINHVERL
jgi:hypothetical protein